MNLSPDETAMLNLFLKSVAGEDKKHEAADQSGGYLGFLGAAVFVRTVTHYYLGLLVAAPAGELLLKDASLVLDTRQFGDFLAEGPTAEAKIECYPDGVVVINRGAIVDVCRWSHDLPRRTL